MDVNKSEDYRPWLILSLAKGLGPANCYKLLEQFKSPEEIISADKQSLSSFGLSEDIINQIHFPDQARIELTLDWLSKSRRHLITIADDDYPALLKTIHAPPIVLFAFGNRDVLQDDFFSIVGSRNPSGTGKKLAESFAYDLSGYGLTICSGLALGVDYHSHLGALNAGRTTVAVLGNGLNSIYPARHRKIATDISENGLLLSEFFPDTKPVAGNFPRRNRIISGLSIGVLVVEAAKQSGSLITANYALEQGREVFAIPGSIFNPLSKGTHSLIKQGAKLVETTQDIIEELGAYNVGRSESVETNDTDEQMPLSLDDEYKNMIEHMGFDDISVDELVKLTGLTADAVSSMLLQLELRGIVESRHGGKYCRCQ